MNDRLQTALRHLRLSGLAETLDVRLHEAATHQLSAQLQSPEVAEPTERAFDDVSRLAQATAVRLGFAQRSQNRFDSQPFDECCQSGRTVSGVALQGFGLGAWPASWPRDGWHIDQEWQRDLVVACIGRRGLDRQRNARRIGQHMPLTAGFRTVRRVRPGVRPQKPRGHWRCRSQPVRG